MRKWFRYDSTRPPFETAPYLELVKVTSPTINFNSRPPSLDERRVRRKRGTTQNVYGPPRQTGDMHRSSRLTDFIMHIQSARAEAKRRRTKANALMNFENLLNRRLDHGPVRCHFSIHYSSCCFFLCLISFFVSLLIMLLCFSF